MTVQFQYNGTTLTFPPPDNGNEEMTDYHQLTGETDAGKRFVEDPGFKTTLFRWQFRGVTDAQKQDFEAFFEDTLNRGRNKFTIKWANPWTTLIKRIIFCDMQVSGGTTIYCDMTLEGSTIYCDQEAGPDYLWFTDVKLVSVPLQWQNQRDWLWNIDMDFYKEPD